jgi:hypothetical protein
MHGAGLSPAAVACRGIRHFKNSGIEGAGMSGMSETVMSGMSETGMSEMSEIGPAGSGVARVRHAGL